MTRTPMRVLIAVAFCLATGLTAGRATVWAGDETCPYPTQECLDSMVSYWKEHGWIGVSLEEVNGAMAVIKVVPESPAEAAGFQPGDVFVAVNGVRYDAEDKTAMKALRATMVPGATLTYVVRREGQKDGEYTELSVTLGTIPRELLCQVIGDHMLVHAQPVEEK